MNIITYTNKGLRDNNEDYLICRDIADKVVLCVLADGMGGYSCGKEAAKIITETIYETYKSNAAANINEAILLANKALDSYKRVKGVEVCGSTIVGALIRDDEAQVFWAGDSRFYLFRNDRIVYQTEDHSLINELKQVRVLTPEQIDKYEHIIRRSIMGSPTDIVESIKLHLEPNDEIIVCSDGLYKDTPIENVIKKLRQHGHNFKLDNELFRDNHSLIYIKL
ncbi:MAG: serine/threonine-protein phosphatase [Bacteroides sp.]|nr:serine/threonine-protein phosphatase [Bacteroides sp.]